jgi:hypothetical protein
MVDKFMEIYAIIAVGKIIRLQRRKLAGVDPG